MANIVVGLYNDLQQAFQVISNLRQAGFDMSEISIISNETQGSRQHGFDDTMRGAFSDLRSYSLRGVGNVQASGPLSRYLTGEIGLSDAFSRLGAQADDAGAYLEALRRGNTLVAVNADGGRESEAVRIMSEIPAVPMQRVTEQWRQSGWKGFDETAQPLTREDIDREGEQILPIIEEEVRVGKREVERGGVRVHTWVEERPVEKTVELREEHVNVERRPVDRPATDADLHAFQEGSFEVRTTAEEAIVDKQARVVEEVVVDKDVEHRQEVVRETERRTNVDVEQVSGTTRSSDFSSSDFSRFDTDWRRHYDQYYTNSGMTYDRFQPAYQYGYTYAGRYSGRNWDGVEMDLRRDWERQYSDSPWERFKDAVREGFQRATR